MVVFVCARRHANGAIKKHSCLALISCNDVGQRTSQSRLDRAHHLQIEFDDVRSDSEPFPPRDHHVHRALAFARRHTAGNLLVNCEAGVSRSTAIALMILVDRLGDIQAAVEQLILVRPQAYPNPIISKFADEILGCNGLLFEASEKIANAQFSLRRS